MQAWSQFYAVVGGAAAALLGLLFVAVSLNSAAALGPGHDSSRRLAEQAFQNYLAVMMVSLLALFPDMSLATFGSITLSVTVVWAAWVLVRLYQTLTKPADTEPRLVALRRHLSTFVGFSMLIGSALFMALHRGDERNVLAASTMVLLSAATVASWELLNRIAKTARSPSEGRDARSDPT
jgi:hypothetical protein